MDIPIDDGDALQASALKRMSGCDRHIVYNAKTPTGVARGVMTCRPDQGVGVVDPPIEDSVRDCYGGASREPDNAKSASSNMGAVAYVAALPIYRHKAAPMLRGMDPQNLVVRRLNRQKLSREPASLHQITEPPLCLRTVGNSKRLYERSYMWAGIMPGK
jgi:hypothetical protein